MAGLDENAILELGQSPVPGAAPCGGDVADDEEYIFATTEVAKVDRIEAEEPDWFQVQQACANILHSKSKDVEIAAALGFALFKQHRYAGLAAAFGLLTQLVNHFWDGLFPERPRRRKARIETLTDKFAEHGWFAENPPRADEFDHLDLCVKRMEELNAALTEKMPDEPPEFGKFIRKLKELAAGRPKPAQPAAGATPSPAAAGGGGEPAAAFSAGEVADRSGAVNAVLTAATFLRKADPADPLPYGLSRVVKWSKVSLPSSDAAKYEIDPPEAALVDTLAHQFGKGLWENLLRNAEAAFRACDPLWLDLQRYVCAALRGSGPSYELAAQTVIGLTAALVRRLGEGVFELRFRGGTPLCSGETKMWIESEAAAGAGKGGTSAGASNGRLDEAAGKAQKLAASGKLKEALAELQAGLASSTQRRDRFLWRLRLAQLCYQAQRLQLAAPLLEECHDDVRRFGIAEWEPSLAVDAAQSLYRCRKSLAASEKSPAADSLDKVRDSFAWLCQLDPLAALAAEPSGK